MCHSQIALHCIVLDNYLGVSISIRAQREEISIRLAWAGPMGLLAGKCLERGVQYETGDRGDASLTRAEDRLGQGAYSLYKSIFY